MPTSRQRWVARLHSVHVVLMARVRLADAVDMRRKMADQVEDIHIPQGAQIPKFVPGKRAMAKWFDAACEGNVAKIRALAQSGADIEATDGRGRTAMLWAAEYGKADVVRALAELGANLNATDQLGSTAIMVAASRGHGDTTRALKELRATSTPLLSFGRRP